MRFGREFFLASAFLACFTAASPGQQPPKHRDSQPAAGSMDMQADMPMDGAMKMASPMEMGMAMGPTSSFAEKIAAHATSGTSAEPNSTPAAMLMKPAGNWMFMVHGNVFVARQQQTSERGGDKFFSTNWAMPMAQRRLGRGELTLRAMLSLEPGTVSGRQYPLLFQQGETAYGKPIADGQHPHDFFMELGVLYDWHVSERTMFSVYLAPVGDPALGPTAYPHRASAAENPLAALGHHQEDSTHISDDVATLGLTSGIFRLEASGFHGREPNEHRWQIQQGGLDSWSARLTAQPGKNWSGQYSLGRLHSLEQLYPTEDQLRMTASAMYNRPLKDGNLASAAIWGRTRSLQSGAIFNSYLFEATWQFRRRNFAWTRLENTDRSNELLAGESPLPPGFQERSIGRARAYTFGYDREFGFLPHLATAFGAQATAYGTPDSLRGAYGSNPVGVAVFLRLRPASGTKR